MSSPTATRPRLLVDTCIWIDSYFEREPNGKQARAFFDQAILREIPLLYSCNTAANLFNIVKQRLKKEQRMTGGEITPEFAAACTEVAWQCLEGMEECANAVAADSSDLWLARHFRSIHNDFEDNLVIAAAQRASANYIVTTDRMLIAHSPVAAKTPDEMIQLFETLY